MVKRNKRKRKQYGPSGRVNAISCPLCNAEAIEVELSKAEADLMMIFPGMKYVCSGKFIYRSATGSIQFSDCYGIPVEYAIKVIQMEGLGKQDVLDVAKNFSKKYMDNVIQTDPFFKNMASYLPKPEPVISSGITVSELEEEVSMGDDIKSNIPTVSKAEVEELLNGN